MAAVREFKLPDLGEGLAGAEVVRWLVRTGEVVTVDQPVVEVETAKAVVEIPCPYAGVVTARIGEAGEEVLVGDVLLTVAAESATTAGGTEGSGNVLVGYGTAAAAGRRRRVPPRETDRTPVRDGEPAPVISPLVRRIAREKGVDLRMMTGTGPDGLIIRADVDRAGAGTGPVRPAEVRIPLRGIRGAVAGKLARSRREIPDATTWVDADATELIQARRDLDVPLLALLARVCTAALTRHPELNATVDLEHDEIVRLPAVHLGFAAQTERGLVVPVVRDAQRRTTAELGAEIVRLTKAARNGTLAPAELTGGTFTLNNYGVFGVDGSTPIINHPEAAMLGIGRIAPKPWVHAGELAVRQVVQLSFTFDHRVCDGASAGGFLRFVADAVERPVRLLRDA